MRRSGRPKVVHVGGDAKDMTVLKAQVSGVFYVVGVSLLVRRWMVGKWSTVFQSPDRRCAFW